MPDRTNAAVPRPASVATAAAVPAQAPAHMMADGNGVQIPFHTIVAILPLELKTRIKQTMIADVQVPLPLDRVLLQLGSGTIRVTFGELKALVPGMFTALPDLDQTEIILPLNEILPQINPALLARRQSQKQLHVPDEVTGPFGKDFAGVTLADPRAAAKPVAAPAAPSAPAMPAAAPRETRIAPPAASAIPMNPIPMAPPAAARPVAPQPVKPAQPIPFRPPPPAPKPAPAPAPAADPIPMVPFRSNIPSTPTPRPPTAAPAVPPVRPALPSARGVGAVSMPSSVPRMPAAPAPTNGGVRPTFAPPAAPAAAPAGQEVVLNVPLRAFSDSWPEVLRGEIVQLNLSEAQLALPVRFIEPALKLGKVAFSWKVLRSWIRPPVLPTVSAHDGMMLELPLRVLAPLFLSHQKKAVPGQAKVQVDENIPNLFFGFPQGESAAESLQEQAAPQPVAQPIPAASAPAAPTPAPIPEVRETLYTPQPKQTKVADTNFYVWNENGQAQVDETEFKRKSSIGTDFLTRYATPNEVVSRAAALDGVAGALVALPDGLMVASKLSPDLNGDTLAAFLPHIFGKVSQCTKELRMGELNNLHFTVGNVPWKIFRVNAIFFAVFGHAGQPLPTANLAALAGELDRKK
ncbi:MAG TPA: roadblock/LC7 domain-containing protein [Candidatus Angelobacter sp.]|nr:roadblock/LC7 domain-containing protein [Candidatus Angelobacter sp.]